MTVRLPLTLWHRRAVGFGRRRGRLRAEQFATSRHQVACGAVAGPLFIGAFTAIGAARSGYDWRRHAVSSLACGQDGWLQRANFIVAGVLYCAAARGLARANGDSVQPGLVPALVGAAGAGLIGSGIFVTDPVGGFPPRDDPGRAEAVPSREGLLHNLSALPVFVGIPVAGLSSALAASRHHDVRWAWYSLGSSAAMVGTFLSFGAAFGGNEKLAPRGGLLQRLSIACGFGWLSALSLRALRSLR